MSRQKFNMLFARCRAAADKVSAELGRAMFSMFLAWARRKG